MAGEGHRISEGPGELLRDHRGPLLAYIEHRMGPGLRSKIEPDDIFQEVSVEAVRTWDELALCGTNVFGRLCELAERRIVDAHRRLFGAQKRSAARDVALEANREAESRPGLVDWLVASLTSPTQALARNDRHQRLNDALATLAYDQREALRLRYVEQMPSKEIAAKLGKSDGAIRVMLTRALKTLQAVLVDAGISGRW